MPLPQIPGVRVGIKVSAPTPEIKQQIREELAKVLTAAGYPIAAPPRPNGSLTASAKPSLRVIRGGGDRQ